jgi:DNA-binding protein HU-beta
MASKKTEGKKPSLTKNALIAAIIAEAGEEAGLSRKDVKTVIEALGTVGHKELKRAGSFKIPGFAKVEVRKRAATKARKGIVPSTGAVIQIPARGPSKVVKVKAIKALKDAVLG